LNSKSKAEIAAEWAAHHVPQHPVAICRDFTPKPKPAEFWCAHCGWRGLLHDDQVARDAVAAELARLAEAEAARIAREGAR
jgi:hypothetical protein